MTSVDYAPAELDAQVPFSFDLVRKVPGPDRPDYWIGVLDRPLKWITDNREYQIKYIVLAARWQGTQIEPLVQNLPIGIAYITDQTQLDDVVLDFNKCKYVAIGIAHDTEQGSAPTRLTRILAGHIAGLFGTGKNS